MKHECSVGGCNGLTCFVEEEEAYENLTKKQFQLFVAKQYGLFCFFEGEIPNIVIDIEGKKQAEVDSLRELLSRIWMGEVQLVPKKEYFLS